MVFEILIDWAKFSLKNENRSGAPTKYSWSSSQRLKMWAGPAMPFEGKNSGRSRKYLEK